MKLSLTRSMMLALEMAKMVAAKIAMARMEDIQWLNADISSNSLAGIDVKISLAIWKGARIGWENLFFDFNCRLQPSSDVKGTIVPDLVQWQIEAPMSIKVFRFQICWHTRGISFKLAD